MTKKRKITMLFLAIALIFSCFLTCFSPTIQYASASSIDVVGGYTDVMDDLKKDEYFDEMDYPTIEKDYSLNVIQIAESEDNELFVYVYQPCGEYKNLVATSLFLSTSAKGLTYKNYYLTLLSNDGVFYKYRVDNFFVSNENLRHYEITSIYRAFDETIDESLSDDNENIINEVNYKVAKHWTFDNTGITSCADVEMVTITEKYVGFVRYGYADGMNDSDLTDRHFVAFSTDRQIDKLLECDVYYKTQTRVTHWGNFNGFQTNNPKSYDYGEISGDKYATLTYTTKVQVGADNDGWFVNNRHTYTWDAIQKPSDFIASVETQTIYQGAIFNREYESKMTEEGLADIQGKQWVVSFLDTNWHYDYTGVHMTDDTSTQTLVSNVSIIRLAFETDGQFYNLGVIDNKQSGDDNPDNVTTRTYELNDVFKIILAILLLIVLLVVLSPILPIIFSFIWTIIKFVFKAIIWVISLPFKLIKAIFKKQE